MTSKDWNISSNNMLWKLLLILSIDNLNWGSELLSPAESAIPLKCITLFDAQDQSPNFCWRILLTWVEVLSEIKTVARPYILCTSILYFSSNNVLTVRVDLCSTGKPLLFSSFLLLKDLHTGTQYKSARHYIHASVYDPIHTVNLEEVGWSFFYFQVWVVIIHRFSYVWSMSTFDI